MYTQEDLDKVLDNINQGPIGQRKEFQWDMVMRMKVDNIGSTAEAKAKIRQKRKDNASIPVTLYKILDTIRDTNKIIDFKVEKVGDFSSIFKAGEAVGVNPMELRLIMNPNYLNSISSRGYTIQPKGKHKGLVGYKDKLAKRQVNQSVIVVYKDGIEIGSYRNVFTVCNELGLKSHGVYAAINPNINKDSAYGYTFKKVMKKVS
jgi:hypothetical protein